MIATVGTPKNLRDAIRYFNDPDRALAFMVQLRWPAGVACPRCGVLDVSYVRTRRIWKCKGCHKQFSAKVGTIFEDSPLGFEKWLPAIWMLANAKNGISSYELARALGVTQKTAWFMLGRIRLAMQAPSFQKWGGEVEMDETYIGGKAGNMHAAKRRRVIRAPIKSKAVISGVLRRGPKGKSKVRAFVVPDASKPVLNAVAQTHIVPGAELFTDNAPAYDEFRRTFVHKVVDHAVAYVVGRAHTNTLENFWSLLKRSIKGTYVSVDPFHLFRYLDEQVFRYNERGVKDGDRFRTVLDAVAGRRLTYADLIGKHVAPATT
jgi:transposase-like protein